MTRVKMLFFATLILAFVSCSKDDDNTDEGNPAPLEAGYIPLHIGNYWVYEQYKIDTLGIETPLNTYDSVIITGTENVDGLQYFVFESTWMSGQEPMDTIYLLRDSSGYYVDPTGWIHFTDQNFTDTLETYTLVIPSGDTLYESWYKMESDPQSINVPAGEFEALNYQGTIYTHNPNQGVAATRYKDRYYSKDVGQVFDTYFYLGSPDRMERRLKHYYIDPQSFN